jgi:hypothetical protein
VDQAPTCPFCHDAAHIVPGETYRTNDLELFEKLESAIHVAQLSELSSQRLWTTLSDVCERGRRPELLLLPVVDAIPTLQFVQEAFPNDRAQLAHAAGMMLVIITAHLRALESGVTRRQGAAV